jgi:uncharacterized membrane-anchored protein
MTQLGPTALQPRRGGQSGDQVRLGGGPIDPRAIYMTNNHALLRDVSQTTHPLWVEKWGKES